MSDEKRKSMKELSQKELAEYFTKSSVTKEFTAALNEFGERFLDMHLFIMAGHYTIDPDFKFKCICLPKLMKLLFGTSVGDPDNQPAEDSIGMQILIRVREIAAERELQGCHICDFDMTGLLRSHPDYISTCHGVTGEPFEEKQEELFQQMMTDAELSDVVGLQDIKGITGHDLAELRKMLRGLGIGMDGKTN